MPHYVRHNIGPDPHCISFPKGRLVDANRKETSSSREPLTKASGKVLSRYFILG